MSRPPSDPYNQGRERELIREEEAFRLRQGERQLETARRAAVLVWVTNTVYFLVGLLEILLGLRFLLRLAGANPENTFAQIIYGISDPFVAPFSTLFISPTARNGAAIFDVNVLIAMLVYALLGWIVVLLARFIQGR